MEVVGRWRWWVGRMLKLMIEAITNTISYLVSQSEEEKN